jgi:hypothetical protein
MIQFSYTKWLLYQLLALLDAALRSPVTPEQYADINFWGGVVLGAVLVVLATWIILTQKGWQTTLLDYCFGDNVVSKALFRRLCMQALEDAVFVFTVRQVVVLTSSFVLPPAVSVVTTAWGWIDWARFKMDGALAAALYILTSLIWYGQNCGIMQRPLHPVALAAVTNATRCVGLARCFYIR